MAPIIFVCPTIPKQSSIVVVGFVGAILIIIVVIVVAIVQVFECILNALK